MAIVFPCEKCGSRFEVDDRFAGKSGRCKNCGTRMTIPSRSAPELRLAPAAAGAGAAPARATAAAGAAVQAPNWIAAVNSQVGLAPLSMPAVAAVSLAKRKMPLDDASFSGLYKVQSAPELPPVPYGGKAAGGLTIFYRRHLGKVQKLLRKVNEAAYLVSVPFLVLLLLGVIVHNRTLALLGATIVVLLNIGRLVSGLGNLLMVPFRDSPMTGLLFLIPPFTFFYLAKNYHRVRKPLNRVLGPLGTILLVVLVFAFVPWLTSSGEARQGTVRDRISESAGELKSSIREKMDRVPEVDASRLKREAAEALQGVTPGEAGGALRKAVDSIESIRPQSNP